MAKLSHSVYDIGIDQSTHGLQSIIAKDIRASKSYPTPNKSPSKPCLQSINMSRTAPMVALTSHLVVPHNLSGILRGKVTSDLIHNAVNMSYFTHMCSSVMLLADMLDIHPLIVG